MKQKINTVENVADDTFSFDLTNIYIFNPELTAPLTGDEVVTLVNQVLVVRVNK